MKYYLAYGSNLNVDQMRYRCPNARYFGSCCLDGWRLLFKGSQTGSYLTIERAKGHFVPLGIWQISDSDERSLDRYEGYPTFYYKKHMVLELADGTQVDAIVYVMHEDRLIGVPTERYVRTCLEGYRDFRFDNSVLFEAVEYSMANAGKCEVLA